MEQVTFVGESYTWIEQPENLSERRKFYDNRCGLLSDMRCYFEMLTRYDGELIDDNLRKKADRVLEELIYYYEGLAKRHDRYDKGSNKKTKQFVPKNNRESYYRSLYR